jgi:hypothetical protein
MAFTKLEILKTQIFFYDTKYGTNSSRRSNINTIFGKEAKIKERKERKTCKSYRRRRIKNKRNYD